MNILPDHAFNWRADAHRFQFRTAVDPDRPEWAAQPADGPDEVRITGRCRYWGDAGPCPCLVTAISYLCHGSAA